VGLRRSRLSARQQARAESRLNVPLFDVEMITRAKRITFLGFDVRDCLILIIGVALVGLLLVLAYTPVVNR
jgi:hypothetical protein